MAVYSHQFVCQILSASNLNLYQVPPPNTVVVRDIEIGDRSGSPDNQCTIFVVTGATITAVITTVTIAQPYGWFQWTGRAVLNPGQWIGAGVSLTQGILISGYLLS